MTAEQVRQVRSFNRRVMTSIGALDEHFLGRDRPMGEARFLWEIGDDGAGVRELRLRLGLDPGYVSRLLRSLERQGLVQVGPDPTDASLRRVCLTPSGRRERQELDRRSDQVADSLLDPLGAEERARLTEAMRQVERGIVRAQVTIAPEPADSADVRWCFGRYFAELDARFEGGFQVTRSNRASVMDLTPPSGYVLVARMRQDPVGCGAVKLHPDGVAEIKRMWVAPSMRGFGVGARVLRDLERLAIAKGSSVARLETNRSLGEAIAMYRAFGYREVPAFNAEPYAHHWFEKPLAQ